MRFDLNSQQQIKKHHKMRETTMRRSNLGSMNSESRFRQDSKGIDELLEPRLETKNEENWPQVN